ncbi:MAG: hypothetical protein LDL14_02055, partial [Nitrospira sp.]|nr:hypothetical protein [Nitrospira sp.]
MRTRQDCPTVANTKGKPQRTDTADRFDSIKAKVSTRSFPCHKRGYAVHTDRFLAGMRCSTQ